MSYDLNFNALYNCIVYFTLLQCIFKIFHAKEITYGHQITTEVTSARLNVLLVGMMSQQQGKKRTIIFCLIGKNCTEHNWCSIRG